MQDDQPSRRGGVRLRTLKGAKILLNNKRSSLDCTVRNLSETGAKLVLPTPTMLPDSFFIRFDDGREHSCVVRWRAMTEVGVEFIAA